MPVIQDVFNKTNYCDLILKMDKSPFQICIGGHLNLSYCWYYVCMLRLYDFVVNRTETFIKRAKNIQK